jgi:RND superfamily putative drug exporter
LLLAFGSVIAMALPIVTAIAAVSTTFGVLDVLSHAVTVPSFGPELAALVGLGVGIDYALFVVTRYRAVLHTGAAPQQAVVIAMAVSGRAVVFAGSTVVLSLLGLFLLGLPFIYGAALGAIIAVALVMAASVTLLPAGLGFAGASIDRLRIDRRSPPVHRQGQRRAGGGGGAGRCSGARGWPGRPHWPRWRCWRCRSPRSGWPSPTPEPAPLPIPPVRPTTFSPGDSGPAPTARSSWP